jgi:glycosyltransferase involved in cell wall biosynthesis
MELNEQLIYIASNSKGDRLFDVLRSRYKESIYIDAGYRSIKRIDRAIPMLLTFNVSLRKSIKNPDVDLWVRKQIKNDVIGKMRNNCASGTKNDVLLWFPLFPITSDWKQYGRLSVITDVAMDEAYFENFNIASEKAREMRKNCWDLNFKNCDHIFTLSKWAMEANKNLYPENAGKLEHIGWGPSIVPPPSDEVLNSLKQDRILSIGHDYYRKGVDIFNEVSRRLRRRLPNLQCVVVGRSGGTLSPSTLDNLTVHPPATPEQISLMMKTSKLFMLFSRFDPSPHVIVEAMAHGLPVICSKVCGSHEPVIHGKTGYIFDVENTNINDISQKTYDLLIDNKRLETFSRNARDQAMAKWQWKHVAETIVRAYDGRRGSVTACAR